MKPQCLIQPRSAVGLLAVAAVLLATTQVVAQTQRSGGDASARLSQQLQQVTAEKDKVQSDYEALKKELEATKARLAEATADQGRLQQRARELEQSGSKQLQSSRANTDALEKTRAQLQEVVGKYREIAQTLKDVEIDRDELRKVNQAQEASIKTCVDKNAQMYLLGSEILDQYGKQGVWSALKSKDGFTQISRARLENLADAYRDRIHELRVRDANKAAAR